MNTTCKRLAFAFTVIATLVPGSGVLAQSNFVSSDALVATDALGRRVGDAYEAREGVPTPGEREGKQVCLFYWTWHRPTKYPPGITPRNVSRIEREHPEAMLDFDDPAWENYRQYYWEEPLMGYYKSYDDWVLRKHAEMLADAKIDAVFFDCTNGSLTWDESYKRLLRVWHQARLDGVNTPKIAFMLPFGYSNDSKISLTRLYRELYKPGLYKDLWYMWDGKPVIMAYCDNFSPDVPEEKEILDFFTYRPGQPDYVNGPQGPWKQWGWLEVYPQHGYVEMPGGGYEEVTVGIAQNTSPAKGGHCSAFNVDGSYSRSFSKRKGFDPRKDGYLWGWNFEEQWSRAFEIDPKMVFVTGWNEYEAGMYRNDHQWSGWHFAFVDQFDWDRSRDIEPNKGWGNKGDVYYYMLIDKVRRFKGVEPAPRASGRKTINMETATNDSVQWEDVTPVYRDYRGDVPQRLCEGAFNIEYSNASGRNDIVEARVARDGESVYFRVCTDKPLSPRSGKNWMVLFIDTDRKKTTGWEGYDLVVNRQVSLDATASIETAAADTAWSWTPAAEKAEIVVGERCVVIKLPRKLVERQDGQGILDFEFKWSDSMQQEGNPMDFYVNGDVAPSARFNYVFKEDE